MRVLLITKGLDIGGQSGGAETFGANLACQLQQDGLTVTLTPFYRYDTPAEKAWSERLAQCGVEVIFVNSSIKTNFLLSYRTLAAICRSRDIDLIHSHNQVGTLFAVWLKVTGIVRYMVRTAHISQEWGQGLIPWLFRQIFSNWVYPLLVNQEVGVSQEITVQLNQHAGARLLRKRAVKIYNAIDQHLIDRAPQVWQERQARERLTAPFTIGSVGRLIRRKGYHHLLDAFAEVARQAPNSRLVLVGEGEERAALEEKTRALELQGRVAFLGQRADIEELLKSFDLFILPSLQEGLPTVVLESMACAVPVIATDIPGTRELIVNGVNGLMVTPENPAALHEAMMNVYIAPALRIEMSRNAIEMLFPYSYLAVSKEYQELYGRVLDTYPKHGGKSG